MFTFSLALSSLTFAEVDFPSWLVAGWSTSFSALIVLTHYS
ncbi:hypothetical protein ACSTJV_15965 [Vibrio parahaemolyticus]